MNRTSDRNLKSSTGNAFQAASERILIVDDEVAIADLLSEIFSAEGYETAVFYDAPQAIEYVLAHKNDIDLIIADIMMPRIDGLELCRIIRGFSDVPIIFLTAKDTETDVVIGLSLGADDYIAKPFRPREVVARAKAQLRRSAHRSRQGARSDENTDEIFEFAGIELNTKTHKASLLDIPLTLTPKEFDILAALMRDAGAPVSSKALYESIWKESVNSSSGNTIMVHIRHLRKKLAEIDSSTEFIKTVWGVGYQLGK